MTLQEAIQHTKEVAQGNCSESCAEMHRQLAEWLEELIQLRNENKKLKAELELCQNK